MGYAVKRAFRAIRGIANNDPEFVGRVLEEIGRRNGGAVTPAMVVQASESKDAPLHGLFEWDDRVAGQKYREQQAAYIIRAVTTSVATESGAVTARAFVHIETEHEETENEEPSLMVARGEYRHIAHVLSDGEMREQMLRRALQDLRAWEQRYEVLSELEPIRMAAAALQSKYAAAA